MSQETTVAIIVLVGVLFTGIVGVITAILNNKQKATDSVIADTRAELAATRAEVKENAQRIAKLESRDRAWSTYVHVLRRHITDEKPPPPPEWPVELDR